MTWILPKQLHTLASALDTEALSLDSNEQSLICAQSLFVRSKPSQLRIWSAKWKRDSWTQHLSGRILKPSLGQRFATEWTSSLGATHASPSVQPANAGAKTTQGTCGPTSQTAFDFSGLGAVSLRTSKDISAWGCPTSSKTWQEWVIERRGAYSQRLNAVRHTSESGSSSWPSPVASEVRQGFQDRSRGMKGSQESLTTVVIKSWPTPNCMDVITPNRDLTQMESKGHWGKNMNTGKLSEMVNYGPPVPASSSTDGSRPGLSQEGRLWMTPKSGACGMTATTSGRPLERATQLTTQVHVVEKSWATPRAEHDSGAHKGKPDTLHSQIKTWPTPASAGVTGGPTGLAGGAGNREKLARMLPDAEARAMGCGKLNPRWVETLMGLPVGWTMPSCASPVTIERMNSDCSVTVLSQQQQNEPLGL